ncbi:FAD-dependent oxidoreductase [Nocardioides rubriscoriae]|uniref:FAD-dependent oxidoreductase n=1 Tax=Nocardioides rubriscoriae TaxID=642762 RepID=UPI001B8852BF|nr:FAD-dependent oxidoreductase [Nocardioides rubriscoriae]
MDADVVVVGAGLAGLRCAVALQDAGLEVVVVEAGDAVGGRIRTDVVDGFRVDRGFQLLNPAYPEVARVVDVDALGLQSFAAGVVATTDDGSRVRLGHPLRAPGLIPSSLAAAVRRPRELAEVARWVRPLAVPRRRRPLSQVLANREQRSRGEALDRAGVDGLLRRVLDRFLAGVLLEDDGSTADDYVMLLLWMFATGVPGLPREGMQALPEQLAGRLARPVLLETPAEAVTGRTVHAGGATYDARAVVVATGGPEATHLVGVDAPPTKGVVTTWWSVEDVPDRGRLLHVDGRTRATGPVVNCAVVSEAAPTYAPHGRHLVQASALLGPGRETSETTVRRHAADLLGLDATSWEVVARHEVPHALPAQPAPYSATRPVALGAGHYVCGDHRDTGSIQGAMVSGRRAAAAVVAALS